jgi:hypothetical protein
MKNVVVTIVSALALVIATATIAFGAQTSDAPSTMSAISATLSRAVLQVVQSGEVAGVQTLPSTSTGGVDGMALALGVGAVFGAFALIRKAVADR